MKRLYHKLMYFLADRRLKKDHLNFSEQRSAIVDSIIDHSFIDNFECGRVEFIQTMIPVDKEDWITIPSFNVYDIHGSKIIRIDRYSLSITVNKIKIDVFDLSSFWKTDDMMAILQEFLTLIEDNTGKSIDDLTMGMM